MWRLVGAEQMRARDQYTISTLGVSSEILMESAGREVARVVLERALPSLPDPGASAEVLVVCGGGNNGGDGLVVARHLHLLGVPVRVVMLSDPAALDGDAAANRVRAAAVGVSIAGNAAWDPPEHGILVDAIFGTGLSRPVEGGAAAAIDRIRTARGRGCRVVSVDLPSGLHSDTGQVLGSAVAADLTVTIGLPKLGLALEPGRSLAGEVLVARIGIADEVPGAPAAAELWSKGFAGGLLPMRSRAGHKGSFGHVLIVAGSEGKTGAAALAATGAGRAGAGLVTIACPAGLNDILEIKCTEAMTVPVADTPERALASAAEDAVLALAAERDVVAIGPGLGRSHETQALTRALAKRLENPLVIDADGLLAFAEEPGMLKARSAPTILTPHPGEAAHLLGREAALINRDRVGAARALVDATGSTVLLKGAATVVADPTGRAIVTPTGGPALAAGGTGDVLTGMVAALLGQGLAPVDAAAVAAYVHGAAGDRWSQRHGRSGLLAGDLADEIPAAMEALRSEADHANLENGIRQTGLVLPFPDA